MATSGAVIARIVSQYSDKGSKAAQKDIKKLGDQIDSWSRKAVKSYAVAAGAAGAFAYKIGKESVQAAIDDSKSAAMLANTLGNVTGATKEQIKAVEDYISKTQMLVNVSDTDLRSSLNTLVSATGDVSTAQYLQTRALDAAAGSGKDLAAVTAAMAKASNGNFTALGKMFPQLDKAAIKSGDFAKILVQLEGDYKGAAEAVAKNDPFTQLKLQFGEVAEQLGYVLLPVVQQFATYIITDVIPNVQEWIKLNDTKLKDSFVMILTSMENVVKGLIQLTQFFEKYKEIILVIAAIPVANWFGTQASIIYAFYTRIIKVIDKISAARIVTGFKNIATGIGLIGTAFRSGGIIATFKNLIALFSMLSPHVKILLLAAAAWGVISKIVGHFTKDNNKAAEKSKLTNEQIAKQQRDSILAGYEQVTIGMEKAKQDKINLDNIARNAAAQKKADDAAKKRAKFDADYAKINARIAKNYGVALLSSEDQKMVQINAAEALLVRQTKLDTINTNLLNKLKEEVLLMKVKNDLAMRYDDILKVLALSDDKLPGAIAVLAQKWGTTIEAVKAYILQFQIVSDGTISDDEVVKLAQSWGSTKEQAAKYLDFFVALNDGVLDTIEIDKLKTKWGMTEQQVRMYADFVGVVNDGKLTDAEIIKIKDKWKLTTDQVVDYIKQIGSPVSYNESLLTPAQAAELAWKNALAALLAYQAALGNKVGSPSSSSSSSSSSTSSSTASTTDTAASAAATAAANASKAAADAYAAAKAKGDMNAAAIAAAGVTPSALASQESGAIGAASIASQLRAAETAQAIQDNITKMSRFREKEAADLAASQALSAQLDYDERSKFRSMTMANASSMSGTSSSGAVTVNLVVNGSVSTEQDLVSAVRNGLLATQTNGNGLTLQAV
jgi:hypothetical protein